MEYLTDIDEFQAALKMVNVNEDMNVTNSNNVLLEGVELDCYHKCQKILDTPEMKKCHKRCLDVNFDELNESDIETINELYDLGIERGLITPDMETEPEENPEDQIDDQNVQDPLKDVGDGCELDDVDGDAYWEMKKALRECGEYGSIDKTIEEEIIDEEYPGNDEEIPPDVQIPEGEDPSMTEYPQSDELPIPDGYDEDELIAALDDNDVSPSDSDIEKMEKDHPVDKDDMPFEAEGDDTASDSDGTSMEDTTTDTEDGDEVQDAPTNDTEDSSDTETTSDDSTDTDDVETGDEGVEDETSDTETDSTEDTTTSDDTEDSSTEDSDTEDDEEETSDDDTEEDDTEDSEDGEKTEEEDKPEEKDLTADDKAQLKNEYTNMFSDIVKGMLSDVEAEDGERAELCVKDMTPEQKSEFWGKVAEQWEGKADPADFMSASELESLENKVEKKEKEESSKED